MPGDGTQEGQIRVADVLLKDVVEVPHRLVQVNAKNQSDR
jgi:hypothetical protein